MPTGASPSARPSADEQADGDGDGHADRGRYAPQEQEETGHDHGGPGWRAGRQRGVQRAVRALERKLGVDLVEQAGRRVRMSRTGHVLVREAHTVLRARLGAVAGTIAFLAAAASEVTGQVIEVGPKP